MRVGVVGASGKTGRAVVAALRDHGADPVGIGRAQWPDLVRTLGGCDAVWVAAPNLHPDEPSFVTDVLRAAATAGVGRVVHHSVAWPFAPAMPHHLAKAEAEDRVRRSGLRWTVLQPCAYLQNLVPGLEAAVLTVPYDPDALFGLVDLADVGEATAVVLTQDDHHGATYELGGPALVSVRDVAAAASRVRGRPIEVARTAPDAHRAAPAPSAREATWLTAMFDSYDRHGLPTGWRPLAALLGRRPTSVADALARELGTA